MRRASSRDPEMHQTKKGNQWYHGMKVHAGVDAGTGFVHTIEGTAANVSDVSMTLAGGQVQTQYTSPAECDEEWFWIVNGILDTTKTGLVEYDGGRFMIAAGRILREVNGLVMDPNKSVWYYLANGQVADYTGLVQFDGAWFYVISGRLATEYSGQMEYDGEWFTVLNGQVV